MRSQKHQAILAQLVEYLHDMQGVTGSSPVDRTNFPFQKVPNESRFEAINDLTSAS